MIDQTVLIIAAQILRIRVLFIICVLIGQGILRYELFFKLIVSVWLLATDLDKDEAKVQHGNRYEDNCNVFGRKEAYGFLVMRWDVHLILGSVLFDYA